MCDDLRRLLATGDGVGVVLTGESGPLLQLASLMGILILLILDFQFSIHCYGLVLLLMAPQTHQYYDWQLIDPQMVQQGLHRQQIGLVLRQIVLPAVQKYLGDLVPLVVFQGRLVVLVLDDL